MTLAPTLPDLADSTDVEDSPDLEKKGPKDYAHILHPSIPEAYVLQAYVEGLELLARCGYRFVPSRDAKRLPLCPTCKSLTDGRPLTYV